VWFSTPLHLAFIDLRKAFDSVPRAALWLILRHYGVLPTLIDLPHDLYTHSEAAVRMGDTKGNHFSVSAGVRQNFVIVPMLSMCY